MVEPENGLSRVARRLDEAFPTWDMLKQQIFRVFASPNQAYQVLSRVLSARQGKKELLDYVQELRTPIAVIQLEPLPEMVLVTIFMEGLRTGVARKRKHSGYTPPPLRRLRILC